MKTNHFSISSVLVLLALMLATLHSGGITLMAQQYEYISKAIPVDPTTGVPGIHEDRLDKTDAMFLRTGGSAFLGAPKINIAAYDHTELGTSLRRINSFGFYVQDLLNTENARSDTGHLQRGVTVLYRFTTENLYIPTANYFIRLWGDLTTPAEIRANNEAAGFRSSPEDDSDYHVWFMDNTVPVWISKGYQIAFQGEINWQSHIGQWIDFDLPTPYVYNGTENLHIVVVYEDNWERDLAPAIVCSQLKHSGLTKEALIDHPNDGACYTQHITIGGEDLDGSAYNYGLNYKPILRLTTSLMKIEIPQIQPGQNVADLSYRYGTILKSDADYVPSQRPGFAVDLNNIIQPEDFGIPTEVRYSIIGPAPSTDVVYSMVAPAASGPDLPYMTITKNDYVNSDYIATAEVPKATGIMAWTTDPDADGRSLDLRNVSTGEYRVMVSAYTKKEPQTSQFVDTIRNYNTFYVRTDNDIEVGVIAKPMHLGLQPVSSPDGMLINVPITNNGFNDLNEFWAQIYLHKVNYNPTTGQVTNLNEVDTLPMFGTTSIYYHFDAAEVTSGPLKTGQTLILNQSNFSGGFRQIEAGWYNLEVKVWLDDPRIDNTEDPKESDEQLFNNVYPRAGNYHLVQAQSYFDPYLTRHTNLNQSPNPSTQTSLGRTLNINVGLVNDGLIDMSYTSGVSIQTTIYKLTAAGGPRQYSVFNTTDIVTRGAVGEGEVTIYHATPWYVAETGYFEVNTILTYDGAPAGWVGKRSSISSFITVRPGLAGNYTIGLNNIASPRNYRTINEALRALYAYGMTSNCVFELTDAVYNEEPYIASQYNLPTLDFRSKIAGASETRTTTSGRDSLYINTIRFVPSAEQALETKSVRINLTSRSGIGMWFGATDESSMYPEAMVNVAPANEKNIWHRNDGNITWDGGVNKSFEFVYNLPTGVTDRMPGERFRVPIYMTNAKNITITNCIITDGTPNVSGHYQLPGSTYNGPTLFFANDYDFMTNDPSTQRTYSAGIIIRSNPLVQMSYGENRYNYETFPCNDIVITNNDISRFAYGIADIGINYRMMASTDSEVGGVRRVFNYNNRFENNLIHEVGRAGIFLGNDENSIIAGNRIHGVSGQLTSETGASVSADCAGILLGGIPRTLGTGNYDAFMVLGTQIYNNEISNVASSVSASGIKLEQNVIREMLTSEQTLFPDRPERMKIYSNIIWGIMGSHSGANRYGINLSMSKPAGTSSLFATVNDGYYIDDILLVNNTIVLDEDNILGSRGDYYGLYLQKIKNTIVQNNAIELLDSTHLYSPKQYDFAAAGVFYQGPPPAEANNRINYNIYAFKTATTSDIATYRYVATDYTSGLIVDKGYSDEYKLLRNWQNWMNDDLYSSNQSFAGDLTKVQTINDKFEKLRLRTDGEILNSPLDKRGTYIAEAVTDIDGHSRLVSDQTFDIGAQIVGGVRNAIDVEVVNIVSPATYQSMRGPLMDAEYFMVEDKPITVRVLVRNNGSTIVQSKKISLSVLQESALTNNKNARIHTDNYTNTYYNDEISHNVAISEFEPINPNAQITYSRLYDTTKTVTIPNGEGVYVDFTLSKTFNTYFSLPGYEVPIQFSRMTPNVTPRYLFTVTVDGENDMDNNNNVIEKYARFYVKKSKRDMLISASNTFNTINYNNQPLETITNPDMVAGRLNLDSLIAGFRKLNLHQSDAESREFDFDVIDRAAWDFRNVDYTLYKTIYFSDELKIDTARWFSTAANYDNTYRYLRDRWLMQDLNAFLNKATPLNKSNLIVGSEEHISDIHAAIRQHEFSFLQPNNTIKRGVVDTFYRTNAIFDSLWHDTDTDPNAGTGLAPTLYGYSPRVPLSRYNKEEVTYPYTHTVYEFVPQPYLFEGKDFGTITGVGLLEGFQFEIKATPWANGTFTDAPPFGTIIKPIESPNGLQRIGAVADTITERGFPINGSISDIPNNQRIVSLLQNTLNTNIVFLGFDWRHYGNLDMLLTAIDAHIRTNGGYEDGSSLPISFYGFDAQPLGNRVELVWNTASETIIDRFELERADATNNNVGKFELLKSIKGKPNTSDNHYNATDYNLPYGNTLAYRLKLINSDGSFTYSNNKIVKIEDAQFSVSDITPNPITSSATFSIALPAEQNIHVAIYDLSGREVLVLHEGILTGNVSFDIQNTDLAAGTYTLSVQSGNQTITRSFTVVR